MLGSLLALLLYKGFENMFTLIVWYADTRIFDGKGEIKGIVFLIIARQPGRADKKGLSCQNSSDTDSADSNTKRYLYTCEGVFYLAFGLQVDIFKGFVSF